MTNKKLLIAIPLIICVTVSMFVALQFTARGQSIPCTVYVDPAETTAHPCNNFLINVNIMDLVEPPIHDYDFFLYYDPSLMTPVNAWDGGFLMPPVLFDWEVLADSVHCWAVSQAGGATGDGTLATIEFHCDSPGDSLLDLEVMLSDAGGFNYPPETVLGGVVHQVTYWEPFKLMDIVEWPHLYALVDIPFVPPGSPEGYNEVKAELEAKGYIFDPDIGGTAMQVHFINEAILESETQTGNVTSWWSSDTLEDGTRACMLSAEMDDGTSMAMGFVTNLLSPEQVPEVDPHIIVNAMPYLYVRFYWWSWYPIGRVVSYHYWWYDSHSHPNWFWGPYWWWRCYTKAYYLGIPYTPPVDVNWAYWRPWWGWWWHWTYWKHWYWWSSYFPYDP